MRRSLLHIKSLWWQYTVLAIVALITIFPLVWIFYSSFKPTPEIIRSPWALPVKPSYVGWAQALSNPVFLTFYKNSLLLVFTTVIAVMIIAPMAAFVFARVQFRGRNFLFYLFLISTMLPAHAMLLPIYRTIRDMDFLNTLVAVMLPCIGFAIPVAVYILRGAFSRVPQAFEDAARLDGASTFDVFWLVDLPLVRQGLVSAIILSSIGAWNEYLLATTMIFNNQDAAPLTLGALLTNNRIGGGQLERLFTIVAVTILPLLVVYIVANRQIIKSMAQGALRE